MKGRRWIVLTGYSGTTGGRVGQPDARAVKGRSPEPGLTHVG